MSHFIHLKKVKKKSKFVVCKLCSCNREKKKIIEAVSRAVWVCLKDVIKKKTLKEDIKKKTLKEDIKRRIH